MNMDTDRFLHMIGRDFDFLKDRYVKLNDQYLELVREVERVKWDLKFFKLNLLMAIPAIVIWAFNIGSLIVAINK